VHTYLTQITSNTEDSMRPHDQSLVRWSVRSFKFAATLLLGSLAACGCPPFCLEPSEPSPAAPNTFCFAQATGVPYNPNPPTIDGVVAGNPGDLGWTNAFRYEFQNGSSVSDASVQGLRDSDYLYLSFEVRNDVTLDNEDAILLAFRPGGGEVNDRRILIFPMLATAGALPDGVPHAVHYWTNSAQWNNVSAVAKEDPDWLKDNIRVTSVAPTGLGAGKWNVEMRIPITTSPSVDQATDTGINLPSMGDFGLYMNVIRVTDSDNQQFAAELPWPEHAVLSPGAVAGDILAPQENTPPPAQWGSGRMSGVHACNGVSVYFGDITISHPDGSPALGSHDISTTVPNVFNVKPRNDAVNTAGTYIPAQGVRAVFRIANRGIPGPGDWEQVADTTPPENLPAATPTDFGEATLSTSPWSPAPTDVPAYLANPSQCVLVELHSDTPGTEFTRRSAWTNMRFVSTSSPFRERAEIGTRGYRLPQGDTVHEFFLSTHAYNTPRGQRWETRMDRMQRSADGLFVLRVRPNRSDTLNATVVPPEQMRVSPRRAAVAAGPTPTTVDVVRGGVVTVIAEGSVRLPPGLVPGARTNVAGPGGLNLSRANIPEARELPLQARNHPLTRVGALIGSWDSAPDSSFFVGSGATLRVPENASRLRLHLNLPPRRQGEGNFQVEVIATDLPQHVAQTNSLLGRDPRHERVDLPVGANLPTWITCGHRRTGQRIQLRGRVFDRVENVGCYGSMVRETGGRE
jgi:hypothetical protein